MHLRSTFLSYGDVPLYNLITALFRARILVRRKFTPAEAIGLGSIYKANCISWKQPSATVAIFRPQEDWPGIKIQTAIVFSKQVHECLFWNSCFVI